MPAVKMYIDKFKKEVLIDDEHPLAVAQRAKPKAEPAKMEAPKAAPAPAAAKAEEKKDTAK